MIKIAISVEAFEAICATLPVGSVAVEPYYNERGERVVWLEEVWVDRLGAMRKAGRELFRRHSQARRQRELTPLRHLGLNWANYPIIEMGEQLDLIVVAMNLEEPRVSLEGVEHTRFLLRGDDDRLHRELWAMRDDGLQLHQHALGVRNVGDHEPRHASKQRDCVDSRSTPRLLEVEDHRRVVARAEFVPQRVKDHLPLRRKAAEDQDNF